MLIATFGPTTGWVGKKITFDDDQFILEGHGPITASDVMQYDHQGHLAWTSDGTRAWVGAKTRSSAPAVASLPPSTSPSQGVALPSMRKSATSDPRTSGQRPPPSSACFSWSAAWDRPSTSSPSSTRPCPSPWATARLSGASTTLVSCRIGRTASSLASVWQPWAGCSCSSAASAQRLRLWDLLRRWSALRTVQRRAHVALVAGSCKLARCSVRTVARRCRGRALRRRDRLRTSRPRVTGRSSPGPR